MNTSEENAAKPNAVAAHYEPEFGTCSKAYREAAARGDYAAMRKALDGPKITIDNVFDTDLRMAGANDCPIGPIREKKIDKEAMRIAALRDGEGVLGSKPVSTQGSFGNNVEREAAMRAVTLKAANETASSLPDDTAESEAVAADLTAASTATPHSATTMVVAAAALIAIYMAMRTILRARSLGWNLTRLTSIVEREPGKLAEMRARGDVSKASAKAAVVEAEINRRIDMLRRFPRHEVTRELVKNSVVASRFGLTARVAVMQDLHKLLLSEGVALDMDTFSASYL